MKLISQAFVNAQIAFNPAIKNSKNPHFKSLYVDLSACIEAVIDALHANKIALIQKTHNDPTGVTVETTFLHESGESFTGGMLHVPAVKQDAQGYGSAMTYARRYSLMAACGLAPQDDDGNASTASSKNAELEKYINLISNSGNIELLRANFNAAVTMLGKDFERELASAATKRKLELTNGESKIDD